MRTRALLRRAVFCLVGFLLFSSLAAIFLTQGALHPARRPLSDDGERRAKTVASHYRSGLANVAIVGSNEATLRAWSIQLSNSNGNAVILLHGLSDNRLGMMGYAEMFLSHGFSVLMPDARAHGASGGQLATYGLLESDDIRRWFDWLKQNQHPGCIFGFGESMGAAQILQSLEAEPGFCALAAESPFASFREIAYERAGQFFHTGPWLGRTFLRPAIEIAFAYA